MSEEKSLLFRLPPSSSFLPLPSVFFFLRKQSLLLRFLLFNSFTGKNQSQPNPCFPCHALLVRERVGTKPGLENNPNSPGELPKPGPARLGAPESSQAGLGEPGTLSPVPRFGCGSSAAPSLTQGCGWVLAGSEQR